MKTPPGMIPIAEAAKMMEQLSGDLLEPISQWEAQLLETARSKGDTETAGLSEADIAFLMGEIQAYEQIARFIGENVSKVRDMVAITMAEGIKGEGPVQ